MACGLYLAHGDSLSGLTGYQQVTEGWEAWLGPCPATESKDLGPQCTW